MHKAYVINLPGASERLARLGRNLGEIGLDFEVVAAVDGRRMEPSAADFSKLAYGLMHGKQPNMGEIGCYLSHIAALRKFLDSGGGTR